MNAVREKARFVVDNAIEAGVRITHEEALEEMWSILLASEQPSHEDLLNAYISNLLREELRRRDPDGVHKLLSINDTGVWSDDRTYVPVRIATIEALRRDLELRRAHQKQADYPVRIEDRAVAIYDENDGMLSVEECLRRASEEEHAPPITLT